MKNNQKIPEGWSVKKLKECLEIKHGKPQHDVEDKNGIYPILASGGEIGRTNSFLCNKPSVLIGRKGTIDKPQYMDTPFWTVDTLFYSFIKSGYLAKYIFYKFETINWNKYNEGSTIPSLSSSTIHSIKVLLPPLAEQEKIAEILGTWDEGIEKLSSLIEQKKLLKKGLMQKLLTGKVRLSTFTQPWKEVKLGAVLEAISRRNKNLNISRVLSVTNSRGFILPEEQFSRVVASENLSNYKVVKNGEFAYNPSRLNVGSIDRLDNFTDGILSPMYVIFKCNEKLSSNYMKHWITTTEFNTKVRNSAQGSVRETVDFKTLSSIKINLPSDISEQQAIADVLSTADDEINLLNQKLEALKEQKKGLMQQLLTGQVRVKVN